MSCVFTVHMPLCCTSKINSQVFVYLFEGTFSCAGTCGSVLPYSVYCIVCLYSTPYVPSYAWLKIQREKEMSFFLFTIENHVTSLNVFLVWSGTCNLRGILFHFSFSLVFLLRQDQCRPGSMLINKH